MDATPESAEAPAERAARLLEKGEPLLAYNELQEALQRWPADARLRRLQALALARSGDTGRANDILRELAESGSADPETLGLLARTHKDLALGARDPVVRGSHLQEAFALYERAYRDALESGATDSAWYTGINAATMAALRGEIDTARRIAAEVRALCSKAQTAQEPAGARYWREATLGEASLILGDAESARSHYAKAVALAARRYGDVSSTRRQARLLATHVPVAGLDVDAMLRIPPVLIYSGHMIDRPDRSTARFPAALEQSVRAQVRAAFERLSPIAAYGSAACGADLLCLEVAREAGCETHIVLPFPPDAFREASVAFAGGDWTERLDRALENADSVTVTSDHHARGSTATFDYANLVLTGMGRLRAQTLDAPLAAIVVRDAADAFTAGGTTANLTSWRAAGIDVHELDIAKLRGTTSTSPPVNDDTPPPSPANRTARHEIRAMLFADAVGYSKLSEDQIPGYITGFLGAVAQFSQTTPHRFEHVETSGDGLYMVFRKPEDAAHYALALSELVNRFDRARWGLPANFNLRVALHCGPVHCATDPITGSPLYTGPHTSRAARIEPITPPGQVYASSAFAAVIAAGGSNLSMSYVGRIPLAKGYGTLGLYHLRAAQPAAPPIYTTKAK
jgi:class 3 adenylate cyclase/tetratricopeptide (TPR) repeat protein